MFDFTMKGDGHRPIRGWDLLWEIARWPYHMYHVWSMCHTHGTYKRKQVQYCQESRQAGQSHRLHLPFRAKLCTSLYWITQRLRCLKQTRAPPAFYSRRYRHLWKIKVAHVNVQKESWCLQYPMSGPVFSQWDCVCPSWNPPFRSPFEAFTVSGASLALSAASVSCFWKI